jgi:chromatin structure-remodeling complex subunit RSC1/2
MPLSDAQKAAIQEIISALDGVTQGGRYKRELAKPFRELPNKEDYPDYYEVIPEPHSLYSVKAKLNEDGYENCLAVLKDLHLVFLNALHYNEDESPIAQDAHKLHVRGCR